MAQRISITETAKLVRHALKQAFPNTTFSVRSHSYSGGSSIRVNWTDGPTWKQVNPILDAFEGSGFDGMQDLKYYLPPAELNGQSLEFGVDFVLGQRNESFKAIKAAAFRVALECELPLLHVHEKGYLDGDEKNQHVPFHYFAQEDVIAHDSHGGEWYEQLVYQVARAMSFESARPVTLPARVTQECIDSKVNSMLQGGAR